MGVIDWERVEDVDIGAINDNNELFDEFFDMIYEANEVNEAEFTNPKTVLKLFELTQTLLVSKAVECENAIAEAEKFELEGGFIFSKK